MRCDEKWVFCLRGDVNLAALMTGGDAAVEPRVGRSDHVVVVHVDRQLPLARWPPVMTAGQRQKQAAALGASGFAYKMLLWPDLAFMGNPLNSDPFKLKWTFLAEAKAPRSQIICMV